MRALVTLPLLLLLAAEPPTPDAFRAAREAVLPAADEDCWDEIRWGTSIWDARVRAAKEGKPILLWEMDGHPLGCT